MQLKIGLLLPRSDMFPALALDFLNGLKLGLTKAGNFSHFPKFIIEGVGNATNASLLMTAEKMILQEEVDLTISFCSFFKLKELVGIFTAYKKPLIHIDLGGNILKKEYTSPYVLHHTLNLWQTAYAAGEYAARTFGKTAALTASFYDGGYQLSESFARGFTNNGGKIVYSYVSPMDYKTESFKTMIDGIRCAQPDVVFTLFSYKEAIKVFETLAQSDLNGKIPFLAIPTMTDELINTESYKLDDVISVASWSFDDENPEMRNFLTDFKLTHEEQPNIISLLGYETALIVTHCINENKQIISKIADYLQNKPVGTPRGKLTFNSFNESQVQSFKIRKFVFNENNYHNITADSIDASFNEGLYLQFQDLPLSGWQNPYICT
jgi:branched-chain amino acid transport system substrate-binding protein